jgi:hypothetical protein
VWSAISTQVLLIFLSLQTSAVAVPMFQLLLHATRAALPVLSSSKLTPLSLKYTKLSFPNFALFSLTRNQTFAALSSSQCFRHSSGFIVVLLLSEGRTGEACKPSMVMLSLASK